jgi:transcriptional regulator with XRE-family HTH domain
LLRAGIHTPGMHIGERIKALVNEKNVSVKALALHCGVSPGAVSNWFRTGRITKENLLLAAEFLGATAEEIISGIPPARDRRQEERQAGEALETIARLIAKLPKLERRQVGSLLPLLAEEPETRKATCQAIMRWLDPASAYEYTYSWDEAAALVAAELGPKKLTAGELIEWVDRARAKPVQAVTSAARKAGT